MTDQSIAEERKGRVVDLLVLTLVWMASVVIVNPIGDFPLNDDWSFGLAVQYFLQLGSFHPTGWTAMTLISNVVWGSLFCLPGGFSFTALRLSTLSASWLGILGAYWLAKELGRSRSLALLTALTMAFNPIYFELSNTFMTEVPCLALMIFSALFFLKNLKTDSTSSLVVATIFSLAAIFSRQIGLAVPMAFALVAVASRGFRLRALLRSLSPAILGFAFLELFQHWMAVSGKVPAAYTSAMGDLSNSLRNPSTALGTLVHLCYACLVSAGLFLSPVLVFTGPGLGKPKGQGWLLAAVVFMVLVVMTACYKHAGEAFMMPLFPDNLGSLGLGPMTLHDGIYLPPNPQQVLPRVFWPAITFIGLIGASLLICRIKDVLREVFAGGIHPVKWEFETRSGVFLLLVSVIYMGPYMLIHFFDRYLIPALPFLAAGLVAFRSQADFLPSKPRQILIAALLAGLAVFSVLGTRDYLAWNRTRWQALDNLMAADQIKPANIDGGFEFNGFYLYTPDYRCVPGKSFWWIDDDTYMVTFNPVPGYSIYRDYCYRHWMPPYDGHIYVLKKNLAGSPDK